MALKFEPGGLRILIIPDNADTVTDQGFTFRSEDSPVTSGDIASVSRDIDDVRYQVGVKVHYHSRLGTQMTIEGKSYLLLGQDDILGFTIN